MKYLITGGCGFIGSHLVEKLLINKNNKVLILDNLSNGSLKNLPNNKNVYFIKHDISKPIPKKDIFKEIKVVFHLAALADIVPSINNPINYYNSNVTGTLNVLEFCKNNKIKKIVYAASSSCYGIPKKFPTSEKDDIDTRYPYALTKKIAEDLIIHWSKIYKINYVSLRLFNVYGLRSRTSGTYGAVFGVFLAQKLNNKPLTIVGNGNQKRDFIHVSDVVEAFILSMKNRVNNNIFNIGFSKPVSIKYIAKLISDNHIYIPKRPGEPDITYANIDKAITKLGWRPQISIEEGVTELINNISYWNHAPIWTKQKIQKATKLWFKHIK